MQWFGCWAAAGYRQKHTTNLRVGRSNRSGRANFPNKNNTLRGFQASLREAASVLEALWKQPGRTGRWNTKVVLRHMILGQGDVDFTIVSVFHASPVDLLGLIEIKIVVLDAT